MLREIQEAYWLYDSIWWYIRLMLPADSTARGLDLWRSHPTWYLHRVLREDCANRRGCCARTCGCCLLPPRPNRAHGAGRCTVDCGCCRKTRGFSLAEEDEDFLNDMFFPGPASIMEPELLKSVGRCDKNLPPGRYYDKFKMVLLFGLDPGSRKSPFKMIDERVEFKPPIHPAAAPPKYH